MGGLAIIELKRLRSNIDDGLKELGDPNLHGTTTYFSDGRMLFQYTLCTGNATWNVDMHAQGDYAINFILYRQPLSGEEQSSPSYPGPTW